MIPRGQDAPGPAAQDGPQGWGASDLVVRVGGALVLDRVTFRVRPGQVAAVVGGDDAGKSEFLAALAGVLPASDGAVHRPAGYRIGYLSAASSVYGDLSVRENLAFRATAYGVKSAAAAARVNQLLARTGLMSSQDKLARELSGGMRKKLGVIAAMVPEPEFLILDEPTTGLDPVSRADLWWLIAVAAADGAAVVMSTSYLDEAERTTSVLVLDRGKALAVGTPGEITDAMPGVLWSVAERPQGEAHARAWLRGGRWRVWDPTGRRLAPDGAGTGHNAAEPVHPDLQDAVTVALLGRELGISETAGANASEGSIR